MKKKESELSNASFGTNVFGALRLCVWIILWCFLV